MSKPDRIVAHLHNEGVEDGQGDQQKGQRIHNAAADNVAKQDDPEQHPVGKSQTADPARSFKRQAGQREEAPKNNSAGNDHEDHAGYSQGILNGCDKADPGKLSARQADDEPQSAAYGGGFGCRDDAREKGVHDDGKENQNIKCFRESLKALLPGAFLSLGAPVGVPMADEENCGGNKNRKDDARDDIAEEELADGLTCVQSIDNQYYAGRNENSQGSPRRHAPGIQHGMIAVFFHGGNGHSAHRRGRSRVGAADGGKSRRGHDGRHGQSSPVMAEPAMGGMVEAVVITSVMDELAHQDEHGDYRQSVAGKNIPELRTDHAACRRYGGNVGDAAESHDSHGESRRDPEEKQDGEHDAYAVDADHSLIHNKPSLLHLRCSRGL